MQIPIDFDVIHLDAGNIIILILLLSLLIFARRVREIYSDIGLGTRRALIAYSMTGIAMAFAILMIMYEPLRFMMTSTGAFFLGAIVIAEIWILFASTRAKLGTITTAFIVIGVVVDNLVGEFFGYTLYFIIIGLSILLVASIYLSAVLFRENPSTFSASLFLILILYILTWVIATTGWTFAHPQYYILQVLPLIVAATVFSSIRKPWRYTLATFILYFTITLGVPLLIASFRVGSWPVFYYAVVEIFAALCLIAPLDYFLEQADQTGARMPLFLGAVITFVALLVSTRSLSWTLYLNQRFVWNQYLTWVNVVLGSCAIIAFMLAAASTLYGDWVQTLTREAMVIFGVIAAYLTYPDIIIDPAIPLTVNATNALIWASIVVVSILGTLMFIRLSMRIARAGGVAAARRLMMFIVSALMIAMITMFSDSLPPEPPAIPIVAIALVSLASVITVFSSPPVTARLSRTVKHLDELSEYGLEEDGSIKLEQ
ncbi:MAG: hypothetical protein ACFFF9_10940 [Candidatus Thorarchaeota archaeon]